MKKCAFCAEEIQDEAIKCRFCGEFFTPKLFAVGEFSNILSELIRLLREDEKDNYAVWEALGFSKGHEQVLVDANGNKYRTTKRPFLEEMNALNEEQLVKAFNLILKMPDFYRKIDLNHHKQNLSEEYQRLIQIAQNSKGLNSCELSRLNKALLFEICRPLSSWRV